MNSFFTKIKSVPSWFLAQSLVKKILVILIILAIGWLTLGRIFVKKPAAQYETAKAEKGTLVVSVEESGTVVAANRVAITTQASGTINNVYVQNGDTVTQGEKIADLTLDSDGLARQASAYSSLLSAQNNYNAQRDKLNSLQASLFKANQAFVNDKGVEDPDTDDPTYIQERANWLQSEADYKNQQGVIAQASAALNSANLAYNAISSTITAPTNGEIIDITIAPGVVISNSQSSSSNTTSSQTVASIKHEGTPIISVDLSEIDAAKVRTGQKATITFDALPDKTFTGKVLGVNTSGSVTSGVTTYPATIALDTPNDSILPNMSATADIILSVKDDVLLVPTGAVQTQNGQSFVRTMKNGKIQNVNVEIGDSSDTETEIKSGLSEGEEIITSVIAPGTAQGASQTNSPFKLNTFGGGGGATRAVSGGGGGGNRSFSR